MEERVQELFKKLLKNKLGISIAAAAVLGVILIILLPPVVQKNRLQSLLRLGERYLSEMSYEQAVLTFNKIIQIDPKQLEAYKGLHEAYTGLGDTENAVRSLTSGMKQVENDDADELKILLIAHGEDPADWDGIRIVLHIILEERSELPELDDILKEMGLSIVGQLMEQGEWEKVKEVIDIFREAFPNDPELEEKMKELTQQLLQNLIEQNDSDTTRETIVILQEIFYDSPSILEEIEVISTEYEAKMEELRTPQAQWHLEPQFEFDDIQPINQNGSRVEKGKKYGIIDYDGNLVWDTNYNRITLCDVDTVYIDHEEKPIIAIDNINVDEKFRHLSDGEFDFGKGHPLEYFYMDIESGKVLTGWGGDHIREITSSFTGFVEGVRVEKAKGDRMYKIVEYTGKYAFCIADKENTFTVYEATWKTAFEFMNIRRYRYDIADIFMAQELDGTWNYYKYSEGQLFEIYPVEPAFEEPEQLVLQSDTEAMVSRDGFKPTPYDFTTCQVKRSDGDYTPIKVAAVKSEGKWGYISEEGEVIAPFIYEEARPFYGEYAWVKQNGKWGVIVLTKDYPS